MGRRPVQVDAGAALVETALTLVLVLVLVLGISSVAAIWGPTTSADRLATRAVRLAAGVIIQPTSDVEVLSLVGAGLGDAELERLIVYRPAGPDGEPLPACLDLRPQETVPAGVGGWCTAYGPGHLAALEAGTSPPTGCHPGSWEVAWCPAVRRPPGDAAGRIGVVLEVRHPSTGVPGAEGEQLVVARAVAALDPIVTAPT